MPGFWDVAIPAAGALVGFAGQSQSNAMNLRQAREQMQFQERMSSTAHQREVRDLRAAGLNPMLSVLKGAGASTPSGTSAVMNSTASAASSSALAARRSLAEVEQINAQTEKLRDEAALVRVQKAQAESLFPAVSKERTAAGDRAFFDALLRGNEFELFRELSPYRLRELLASIESSEASAASSRAGVGLTDARTVLERLRRPGAENEAWFEEKFGKVSRGMGKARDAVGDVVGVKWLLKSLLAR